MIVAGTYPPIHIDLGKDEPGMTLQREYCEDDYLIWRDHKVDGEIVKSPVDVNALPWGKYQLVE